MFGLTIVDDDKSACRSVAVPAMFLDPSSSSRAAAAAAAAAEGMDVIGPRRARGAIRVRPNRRCRVCDFFGIMPEYQKTFLGHWDHERQACVGPMAFGKKHGLDQSFDAEASCRQVALNHLMRGPMRGIQRVHRGSKEAAGRGPVASWIPHGCPSSLIHRLTRQDKAHCILYLAIS